MAEVQDRAQTTNDAPSEPVTAPAQPHKQADLTLAVEGMTCASCALRIERGLKKLPGVSDATVNLATERATVAYDPAAATVDAMLAKVTALGYSASPIVVAHPAARPSAPAQPAAPISPPEPTSQVSELNITGMTCASCALLVERALGKTSGVNAANVNLATERATVPYDPALTPVDDLLAAVTRAGYGAEPLAPAGGRSAAASLAAPVAVSAATQAPIGEAASDDEDDETAGLDIYDAPDALTLRRQRELRHRRNTLLLGIALTLPVVILSMFFMGRFPGENLLLLALTTPVCATSAGTSTVPRSVCCATSAPTWMCW